MKSRIIFALIIEVIYILCMRHVNSHYDLWSPSSEILQGILRASTVLAYFLIFKEYILSIKPSYTTFKSPYILTAIILFLSTPLLIGNADYMPEDTRYIFAFTCIFVGLREELIFRVLIQNGLEKKLNPFLAILLTTIVFTIWHKGAISSNVFAYGQVFFASIILGSIYYLTKSFMLVALIHATYDALFSITPIYSNVINHYWGFVTLITAMTITVMFLYKVKKC